jgi:hypothetical protein
MPLSQTDWIARQRFKHYLPGIPVVYGLRPGWMVNSETANALGLDLYFPILTLAESERKLNLEYCREIDEHNTQKRESHWGSIRKQKESYNRAPFWQKVISPPGPLIILSHEPIFQEPTSLGFMRWRSRNRAMPEPEPLAIRATIPTTESAINVRGDEAGSARIMFDIYPEDLDQLKELLKFRGRELIVVIQEA